MRFFNTAGPCDKRWHFMLPASERLRADNVMRLIEQHSYFVLHAPRQVGKTTAITELARELTASGKYTAAKVSMEVGRGLKDDVGAAELAMLSDWRGALEHQLPVELLPPAWPTAEAGNRISTALQSWARQAPRPLVVFLDEIDALQDDVLLSVLRQLRSGYDRRPDSFPAALALVGLRDVLDYKVMSGGSPRLGTPSPFNIAVRSLTLRNFTDGEVAQLLGQHTAESGQAFAPEALQHVFELTQGQPWLVNALAKTAVEDVVTDVAEAVTVEHIEQAKELVIARRPMHLGQLTHKLTTEERVRRVIEPMLAGGTLDDVPEDDRQYVADLGLVRRVNGGNLEIANPIYREVIPRYLSGAARDSLPRIQPTWLNADGSLNAAQLLEAFLAFWRQHGQPLLRAAPYHEIAPHLVLMAFLDRVVNGGGSLEREYAIGSDRMDLHLRYGAARLAIELKVWRAKDKQADPLKRGLAQLDDYLNGLGLTTGWLVLFDQRAGLPDISERTTTETAVSPAGRTITVIRA